MIDSKNIIKDVKSKLKTNYAVNIIKNNPNIPEPVKRFATDMAYSGIGFKTSKKP